MAADYLVCKTCLQNSEDYQIGEMLEFGNYEKIIYG